MCPIHLFFNFCPLSVTIKTSQLSSAEIPICYSVGILSWRLRTTGPKTPHHVNFVKIYSVFFGLWKQYFFCLFQIWAHAYRSPRSLEKNKCFSKLSPNGIFWWHQSPLHYPVQAGNLPWIVALSEAHLVRIIFRALSLNFKYSIHGASKGSTNYWFGWWSEGAWATELQLFLLGHFN